MQLDDPSYELRIKQTLIIKPKDFFIRASLREGTALSLENSLHLTQQAPMRPENQVNGRDGDLSATEHSSSPITILYGSNTATCQALAQKLAAEASNRGYKPNVQEMDAASRALPKNEPVVVITASYEGQPPDSAGRFF